MTRTPNLAWMLIFLAAVFIGRPCRAFSPEDTHFKGDLRLRYQYDRRETAGSPAQRHRARIRLRFGFETGLRDNLSVGVGLASGQADNRSTNQTLTGFFTTKELRLDKAFAVWEPAGDFTLLLGKYDGAFLIVDDLIWDGDITFEGVSGLWERLPGRSFGGMVNAGFFLLSEDKGGPDDPHVFYVQPGLIFDVGDGLSARASVVYYDFEHVKGSVPDEDLSAGSNTLVDGRLKYDYDGLNPSFRVSYKTSGSAGRAYAVTLLGDYIYNLDAKDSGFLVGVRAGHASLKDVESWVAYYNYRRLETDAFMDVFPDSDFYGGATNVQGHEFAFQYAVAEGIILGLDYYRAERIEGDNLPANTLQVDCVFKF